MKFNATIKITPLELKHIIGDYLEKNGIKGISDRNIHFDIHRDSYGIAELTSVIINDILIGGAK